MLLLLSVLYLLQQGPRALMRLAAIKFISLPHTGSTVEVRFLFMIRPFTLCILSLAAS